MKILIHSGHLSQSELSSGNRSCSCDLEDVSLFIQEASSVLAGEANPIV